ncbi:MAG: ATP-binding protein [Candidatus Woesearchaeota archaeon]
MYEIIVGRNAKDREKFGTKGTILLGKQYVKMGQTTSLANEVYMDISGAHVVFICGKRGSGKSYTMGAIAEGLANADPSIKQNLSMLILDTMGIYWTMKYPNHKEEEMLKEWGFESKALDITIFTPGGFFDQFKEQGIPTDYPFYIKPSELNAEDWCLAFSIEINSPAGVLLERTIGELRKKGDYGIEEIVDYIKGDQESEKHDRDLLAAQFIKTEQWGLFSEKATSIENLISAGKVSILDVSAYSAMGGSWAIKALVIGLVCQKLFTKRMVARKGEEYKAVESALHYFGEPMEKKQEEPLVWVVLDEAHEVLPNKGKTAATSALVTILREGRQPGISLILASQQPGKIHTDVMTQADIVISHQLTAKLDVDALGMLMQSYMREGLDRQLDNLPKAKGSALVFDDVNERIFPIKVRPRFTWHGGGSPTAIKEEKKLLGF